MKIMDNRTNCDIYTTYPYPCGYLPNRLATTVFVEPSVPKNPLLYSELSKQGFRRSGERIYRPKCVGCQECIAVRIAAQQFTRRRSQRRVWQKNQDLTVSVAPPTFKPQHFNLYRRYLSARHEGDGMDNPTPKSYMQFVTSTWSNTVFVEFSLKKQLLAIAVVDYLENGLSAMYTFFEPNCPTRSLGVYAVLWEIEEAKRLNLDWVYLGYWIKNCRKMSYKTEYQPLEYFYQEKWQQLNNRDLEIK
jgi:arginine-tRNA-protein transferase